MADPRLEAERRQGMEPVKRTFEDQFSEESSPVGAALVRDHHFVQRFGRQATSALFAPE